MSVYCLLPHCKLVVGAKKAAIYDLNGGRVYSVDEVGREVLLGKRSGEEFWVQLNALGLAEEGVAHDSALDSVPPNLLRYLCLEITGDCNLKCIHCYGSFSPRGGSESLPVNFWLGLLGEGFQLGCRKVEFVGGEPLKYPGWDLLVTAAHEMGYPFIEVFTNGTLVMPAHIEFFSRLGIQVAVSLYSTEPGIHDSITRCRGSFDRTMKTLKMLREAGVRTRVALVIMRQNQHTVEQTVHFVETSGFIFRGPRILKGVGRGKNLGLSPDTRIVERWVLRRKPQFRTSPKLFARYRTCNPCWGRELAVSFEGVALPCVFARDMPVGDLKEESLREVLGGEALTGLRTITKDKIGVCRDCEYRYACGDCRVLAYEQAGDLYAKTPLCAYDPYTGVWM